MPKWKKNETEFNVALDENSGSHICRVPKPIVEKLGIPDSIKFVIDGRNILVKVGKNERGRSVCRRGWIELWF